MAQVKRKIVRPLAKGQITIPVEFREARGIDDSTLLSVALVEEHLEITPVRPDEEALRQYTDEDIARFLNEDKLDPEVGRKVRELLRRGAV